MDNNRLIELGLGKVCRACLSDEGEMRTIFCDNSELSNVELYKMFTLCTNLQVKENDGLPDIICSQCELRLSNAFNFRELCIRSNATLRKYIENAMTYSLKEHQQQQQEPIEEINLEGCVIIDTDFLNENDSCENNDVKNEEKSDEYELSSDSDDQPLLYRQNKKKMSKYSPDVVNQAIVESRKKNSEKKECRLCGFVSSNARGLSLHIAHLHKELKDKWCNVCFTEVDDLSAHVKNHKRKSYNCTFCRKSFSSQGHLTEHFRSHSMDRPYKCSECGKGFLSARHLKVHGRVHSGERPYACSYCSRCFTQKGSLHGHVRLHTGNRPFHCQVCDKKWATSSALAIHKAKTGHATSTSKKIENETNNIENGLSTDDKKSELNLLPPQVATTDRTADQRETQKQEQIIEQAAQLKKLCTVCGKQFSTAAKLRLHNRVHTGETPYGCQFCSKRFSTRGQLVVHTRTHTGERPHVCHVCGKGFAQSSVLNTHMRLHTGRPEVCQVCQQRFCRPAELRLHMRKHTGEKPYLCTECGQAFIQRSHLMEHIKIHSDERPYKCNECDRAFKQSSSLKSHKQIHSGYKPYKCTQCPYACRQPYSLTQHMRQHSTDTPQLHRPHVCLVCQKKFTTNAMLIAHTRTVHQAIF